MKYSEIIARRKSECRGIPGVPRRTRNAVELRKVSPYQRRPNSSASEIKSTPAFSGWFRFTDMPTAHGSQNCLDACLIWNEDRLASSPLGVSSQAPDLLPVGKPRIPWSGSHNMRFSYDSSSYPITLRSLLYAEAFPEKISI